MIDSTDMCNKQVTIDITYAKNALFVRQSVAVAFGVPIDREITWVFLQDLLCNSSEFALPARVLVCGLPSASGAIGDEIRMLRTFLRALATTRSIEVQIVCTIKHVALFPTLGATVAVHCMAEIGQKPAFLATV